MSDSDDSFFDSTNSGLSTASDGDEEARVGTNRKQRTMRSVPKGKKGDYGSTRQDDYSADELSDDDSKAAKDGNDSLGSDADSVKASDASDPAHRTKKKKRHPSAAATSKGAQDTQSSSKKWWYIGAALAVLLAALIFGGLYFVSPYNQSKSDSSASESASSLATTSDSIAVTSTAGTTAPQTPATSAAVTPSAPVLSTPDVTPTRTSPALTTKSSARDDPAPSATYAAQITWYKADHEPTECGTKPSDDDYVVRVSPELYGDAGSVSPLCGTWITLYQLEKDATARATIEGISPNMTGHNLDLSPKVFKALTSNNLKLGMTLAQWWLTDEKHRPHSSLSRPTATAGDWAGETENDMRVTIATVPNPTNAATANGNEPQAIAGGFQTADFRRRY